MKAVKKAVFNWSGGKDSALALHKVLQAEEFEVVALLTTINASTLKSTFHEIPLSLLEKQAKSIGIPLHPVHFESSLKNYPQQMKKAVDHFKSLGVTHFIYGDIHLAQVKSYREGMLAPHGIEVYLPLWGKTSEEVMEAFLATDIQAKIVVTQADKLGSTYIGKNLSKTLIHSFPKGIDICGEEGEYHTLTYKGGPFKTELNFHIHEVKKIHHDFKMDTGEMKRFEYWQAEIDT